MTTSEMRAAVEWILNDAQYKAPEQIGEVASRWLERLRRLATSSVASPQAIADDRMSADWRAGYEKAKSEFYNKGFTEGAQYEAAKLKAATPVGEPGRTPPTFEEWWSKEHQFSTDSDRLDWMVEVLGMPFVAMRKAAELAWDAALTQVGLTTDISSKLNSTLPPGQEAMVTAAADPLHRTMVAGFPPSLTAPPTQGAPATPPFGSQVEDFLGLSEDEVKRAIQPAPPVEARAEIFTESVNEQVLVNKAMESTLSKAQELVLRAQANTNTETFIVVQDGVPTEYPRTINQAAPLSPFEQWWFAIADANPAYKTSILYQHVAEIAWQAAEQAGMGRARAEVLRCGDGSRSGRNQEAPAGIRPVGDAVGSTGSANGRRGRWLLVWKI
jgi:hypothetical protein